MPDTAETMTRNATGSNNIVNSRVNSSRNIMRSNITREVTRAGMLAAVGTPTTATLQAIFPNHKIPNVVFLIKK
jgi:hypothetical protein